MKDLKAVSIELIRHHQHPSGAYLASPHFEQYQYSWLRDGSFIAYAMLREGAVDSCEGFLAWVNGVVLAQRLAVERIVGAVRSGHEPNPGDYLPTRYNLDGSPTSDDWPNHQIDGYGTWLWLLSEYIEAVGDETILHRYRESIRLTLDYLSVVWDRPTYDCWEEFGDAIHPSTLACLYGGIGGINRFLAEKNLAQLADRIKDRALAFTEGGRFRKNSCSRSVEASLLWLAVPFELVQPHDERMRRTVKAVEEELLEGGGLRRYPEDTYYGGGLWPLLGCWLGWYYLGVNAREKAEGILRWVELQADGEGELPEQVPARTTDEGYRLEWEKRWGTVARPLLWSHAMYLVLRRELTEG